MSSISAETKRAIASLAAPETKEEETKKIIRTPEGLAKARLMIQTLEKHRNALAAVYRRQVPGDCRDHARAISQLMRENPGSFPRPMKVVCVQTYLNMGAHECILSILQDEPRIADMHPHQIEMLCQRIGMHPVKIDGPVIMGPPLQFTNWQESLVFYRGSWSLHCYRSYHGTDTCQGGSSCTKKIAFKWEFGYCEDCVALDPTMCSILYTYPPNTNGLGCSPATTALVRQTLDKVKVQAPTIAVYKCGLVVYDDAPFPLDKILTMASVHVDEWFAMDTKKQMAYAQVAVDAPRRVISFQRNTPGELYHAVGILFHCVKITPAMKEQIDHFPATDTFTIAATQYLTAKYIHVISPLPSSPIVAARSLR